MVWVRARWVFGVSLAAAVAALLVVLVVGSWSQADQAAPSATVRKGLLLPPSGTGDVVARRSEFSRSYRQSDGSMRTLISAVPLNYRDASGAWQPVDTTLRADGSGGVRSTEAAVEVALPHDLSEPVKVAEGSAWVGLSVRGASPGAAVDSHGSTARYDAALDGVDIEYVAQPRGVKETLTMTDRSAPSDLRFDLKSSGLAPALREDGSLVLRDGDGHVRFVFPAPTVQAADDAQPSTRHVAYELSPDNATLTVAVDPAWLAAAQLPVKVDPTVYDGAAITACNLASGSLAATSDCSSGMLQIGYDGSHVQRVAMRWGSLADDGIPTGAAIDYAQLGLTSESMTNTAAHPQLDVAALGHSVATGATWNTYDEANAWNTAGGDVDSSAPPVQPLAWGDYFSGEAGEPLGWDVSGLVQSWLRDGATNHGLLVKAHDESVTNTMSFDSPTGTAQGPWLAIDWRNRPGIEPDRSYQRVEIDDRSELAVDVVSGNLDASAGDIHLPGASGLDLDVRRDYNSADLANEHFFGSAWTTSINGAALDLETHFLSGGRTLYANGGAVYRFDRDTSADHTSGGVLLYGFKTPAGIDATMEQNSDTGATTVTFTDGTIWTYSDNNNFFGQVLTQVKDPAGNHIDLTYDSDWGVDGRALKTITDTDGHELTVTRTGSSAMSITDTADRHWDYTTDTTDGHLVLTSATDADDHTTTYTYADDIPDSLRTITPPDGHDIDLEYDEDGDPNQITKITRHLDNDQIWQLDYTPDENVGQECDAEVDGHDVVGRTVVTGPDTETTYCYDNQAVVLQTLEDEPAAPSSTAPPTIDGTASEGETLQASHGEWGGDEPMTYAYQWQRCDDTGAGCADIDGATDERYTLASDDIGATVAVVVTATNAIGTASAAAAATDVVVVGAPRNDTPPSVDGNATVGKTLTSSDGEWSLSAPLTFTRRWQRCDSAGALCHDIPAATEESYTLTSDDLRSAVRIVVTATGPGGTAEAASDPTELIGPPAPSNTTPPAISGDAADGATLTASDGTWSAVAPLDYSYQWRRCDAAGAHCADIDGETDATYTLSADDVGSSLRVVVTADDGDAWAHATSAPTATITARPPANTTPPAISGTAVDSRQLTVSRGVWSGTEPLRETFQWRRCDTAGANCQDIDGATGGTYTLNSTDVGATLTAVVNAVNDVGLVSATSAASDTVLAAAPANVAPPAISGTAMDGETVTAGGDRWSGTNPAYSHQWRRCDSAGASCADISGATGASYVPVTADVAHTLRVVVTATNAVGAASRTSAPSEVVAPEATFTAAISGVAQIPTMFEDEGDIGVLRAVPGDPGGSDPVTFAYQWQRCDRAGESCANIADELARTYPLQSADLGYTLRVVVTATDGEDTVTSAVSPPTAVVAVHFATPYEQILPAVAGHTAVGSTVTASPGDWPATSALSYAWQRCDADGVACSPIAGATSAAYVIQAADADGRLAVTVTGTDALGTTTLISRLSEVVSFDSMINTALPTLSTAPGPRGAVVSATAGSWSSAVAGDISYTYQWQRCDADGQKCVRLLGEDDATHALGTDDVGDTVRALVVASDTGGRATARSAASDVVEAAAPTAGEAPTIGGAAREGAILSADGGTWTGVGTVALSYQWQRCDVAGTSCEDVDGAGHAEYTPEAQDAGHRLRVSVTAANDEGSTTVASAPTAEVTGVGLPGPGPDNSFAPTIAGAATAGQTLTADPGLWTGSGTITYTYQWQTCDPDGACVDIARATDASIALTSLQVGALIKVLVTATDADGSVIASAETQQTVASSTDIVLDAAPVITGTLQEGEEVTVSQGAWTPTHDLTFDVQWQSCAEGPDTCESIPDATAFTYTPSADDAGLRAVVTASDADGHRVAALSAITDAVVVVSPVALGAPGISGAPVTGQTLHATAPAWDGDSPIESTYQWQRCDDDAHCDDIDGATHADHVIGTEDIGAMLAVEVIGTNDHGTSVASSDPTAMVTDADVPSAQTLPSIIGVAAEGETLTADPGTWTTTGTATYDYQWLACTASGETCDPIDGETGDNMILGPDQTFGTVRFAVTTHDDNGEATVRSPATATIAQTPPADDTPIVSNDRPTIDGTPRPGFTLTADPGTWTAPPDLTYQYRWRECDADNECSVIDGATDATFVPTTAEVGLRIGVFVTAVSGAGAVTVASDLTRVVVDGAPVWTSTPYLDWRDAVQGETVSVDPGTWSDPDAQITETWMRCDASGAACDAIPGATDEQYVLSPDDVGHTISTIVTASNDLGSASYTTSTLGPVQGEIANVTPPALTGDAVAGSALSLDYGQWSDSVSTLQALWQRCDASGDDCADLGVSSWESEYPLTKADVGHTIKATIIAGNAAGQVTMEAEPSDVVVAAAMPQNTSPPTLSGTAQVGETLTVDDGTWTGAAGTTDYDWLRCDADGVHCHEIEGAHEVDYRVARADAGRRIRALVTVTNAAGSISVRTTASAAIPTPPAISSLTAPTIDAPWGVSAGNTVELTASGVWAGAPQTVAYQWQRCVPGTAPLQCTDIPDAANTYYNTYSDDVGFQLRLAETASDPTAAPVTAYSAPTTTPVSINVYDNGLSISGARAAGQTITAQAGAWTPVSMPQSIDYRFERFDGSTSTTVQDGPDASYALTDLDVGQQIIVTATVTILATDEVTPVASVEETTTVFDVAERLTNDAPPMISGDTTAGAELTAAPGTWDGGGATLAYTYTWQRCDTAGSPCDDIDGASASSYRTTADDIGHPLRVEITARPDAVDATSVTAVSATTGPIAAGDAPENTVPPTISGDPAEREQLAADQGTWTSAAPITYTYRWQRCDPDTDTDADCADIDDATDEHYTATGDDLGSTLRVVVTATNASGAATAASDTTETVAVGELPVLQGTPSMTLLGTPDPGSTLVTDGGDWDGADEDNLSYDWQRCDWLGADCERIDGAGTQSYNLTDDDIDHQINVIVTAQNDAGTTQATSQLSETITSGPAGLMRAMGAPARTSAANRVVYYDHQPDPAFDGEETQSLRLVDQDGGNPTTVATCGKLADGNDCILGHPRISPNLKMITVENHPIQNSFARSRNSGSGIYVINYDGSRPRYLADGLDPVWSPDGTNILYTRRTQGNGTAAMIVRADGRRTNRPKTLLTFNGRFANTPELASDGSVAFAGGRADAGGDDLYIRPAGSKTPHRIALPSRFADVSEPRFTTDETAVTFMAVMSEDWNKDNRYPLASGWKINVDGTGLTRMTPDDNHIYDPGAAGTETYITAASDYHCENFDGRCNFYSFTGGTLMVGDSSGNDLKSLGVGNDDNPAHEPSPAPTARAASPLEACRFHLIATKNDHDGEDAVHFRAANQRVGFNVNLAACGPNVVISIHGSIRIVQLTNQRVLQRTLRLQYQQGPNPKFNAPIVPLRYPCTPEMDGLQDYLVTLIPDPVNSGIALRPGRGAPDLIVPGGPSSQTVHLRCPTTVQRQEAEFTAWSHLGAYNPKTHRFVRDGAGVPSRVLGQNIAKLKPSRVPGAWDAHHVIPARDANQDLRIVQAGAFRCHIYPNSASNGVWLRNYAFKSDTESYDDLDASERKRTWHPLTYIPSLKVLYFQNLASDLIGHGIGFDGTCTSRSQLRRAIRNVIGDLIDGSYLPRSLEEDYGS